MAKVTITVEGETQEIRAALQGLLGTINGEASNEEPNNTPPAAQSSFTPEEVAKVWKEIRPEARTILAEIAKHPEGYSFEDVRRNLGLEGLTVAGRLSSLGFAIKRLNFNQREPKLLSRDWNRHTYRMSPEVAETIRELAKHETDKQAA